MPQLSPRSVIAAGLAGTMAIAIPAAIGSSNAQPANKAVAAGSTVQDVHPGAAGTQIMTATFKTSKPEDLLMSVSLECSIITDVMVPGSDQGGSKSTGEAAGTIKVWLTLDGTDADPNLNIVPITDTSAPPQDPGAFGGNADKVTFCDRDHKVTLTDKENSNDGNDALEEYQLTKTANAFNWVRLNAGSGDHTIRVWAQFLQNDPNDPLNTGATDANSASDGFVGNRTLVIEPTKLANNAVIGTTGSN